MSADTLAPPAALPSGVTIIEGAPPKPPPPPTTEIRVSALPKGDPTLSPTRPGSAKARMHAALEKKAGIEPSTPPATPSPETPADSPATPGDEARPGEGEPETPSSPSPSDEQPTTPPATEQPPAGKPGKVSPWKLWEGEKAAHAKTAKEYQDFKASIVPERERQALTARVEQAEAKAKAYEEHMRFLDYSKHPEFQEKYQKPYEQAWARAMSDLKELTVGDPATGAARPISSEDMLELVQLPLQKAREIADSVFGKFADDVMAHRKEIKTLFEAQTNALAEAKKNGSARTQQQMEAINKWRTETTNSVRQIWEKANAEALADPQHGEYFKPKEGNAEWNQRLGQGAALVDKAFSVDPMDPRLSPEDRAAAVKRHAAVRNRAMAYGPLRWENAKLKSDLEAVQKELAKYKGSTPPAGGRDGGPAPAGRLSAMEQMHEDLKKRAH